MSLPDAMVTAIEDCGFFESIPLWAVTIIGKIFYYRTVVYYHNDCIRKIFKLYMYAAIAPIPLCRFCGRAYTANRYIVYEVSMRRYVWRDQL